MNRDQLIGFVEKLTRAGVGPKGQLGKLDALSHAVRYYQLMAMPHERTKETTLNDKKKKQACETMAKSSFCVEGFPFTKLSIRTATMDRKSLKETALLMSTLTALKRLYWFVGILYTD